MSNNYKKRFGLALSKVKHSSIECVDAEDTANEEGRLQIISERPMVSSGSSTHKIQSYDTTEKRRKDSEERKFDFSCYKKMLADSTGTSRELEGNVGERHKDSLWFREKGFRQIS